MINHITFIYIFVAKLIAFKNQHLFIMEQYLAINHHDNVTKHNMRLGNHLFNYHNNKSLAKEGDTFFDGRITFFNPFLNDWNTGYTLWHASFYDEMEATAEINVLLDQLIGVKAPEWVFGVLAKYSEKSTRVRGLIPHKRKALITGTTLEKITAIDTFITGIGDDALLVDIKASAVAFVPLLRAALIKQDKAKEDLATFSSDQEILRVITCQAMLAEEGALIDHYFTDAKKVDLFFDISAMRKSQTKKEEDLGYNIELLPEEIKLLDLRFTGKEIWSVENKSTKDACLFFGITSNITTIPQIKFTISAGTTIQIDLSTLANTMRFAYAANLSSESNGALVVKEVK